MWLYGQESIKVSYHPAKFGGYKHLGGKDDLSLSRDFEVMTSSSPVWLVSFASTPLDVPVCHIW